MHCQDARKLIGPSIDGELDVPSELELAEHLDVCAECQEQRQRQEALSAALRRTASYHRAPDGLREAIVGALPASAVTASRTTGWSVVWRMLNGGGVIAAICALLVLAVTPLAPAPERRMVDELAASHARALLTKHSIDVVSSDQHTVKPWFDGRIDYSPPVPDLASQGFSLVGGRLDYVDGQLVAVVVYQRRLHLIDVFIWPEHGERTAVDEEGRRGYRVIGKTARGMTLRAVSDLSRDELRAFVDLL
jgi:anti-sigma factor RsiW